MPHRGEFKKLIHQCLPYYKDTKFKGIEIGCHRGDFCSYLLQEFGNLSMVTIDPMPLWGDVIANRTILDRLWIICLPSDKAVQFLDPPYDFVFIDGDHSYEQCRRDILNYEPLIKPGGLIAGHNFHDDPNSAHPGVHRAVKEIFGGEYKLCPDYTWYVQK